MTIAAHLSVDEIAATVFIDIAVIVVVARLMGAAFRRIRQPAVVGEILAGILLGPTLLGALPGNLDAHLFPHDVQPYLKVVAQLGLIIFMFIVGLELDLTLIRGKERQAAVISLSSIVLPFSLGMLLATVLYDTHGTIGHRSLDFVPFAMFIGAAMSVTAFPVLARILTERGMYRTEVGTLTLACAAIDDLLAWSLLALVVAVVQANGILDLPAILAESLAFIAFMFLVVRRLLRRLVDAYRRAGRLTPTVLSVILVGFLTSAWITSKIGIHAIFGAFLFGVIMPREGTADLFREILERLEQVSVLLLLPVFFIATGLDANVRGISGSGFAELALIILVACVGKFFGAFAGARAQGVRGHKASAVGVLMNTRGLTELVILNVGLQQGVLDRQLFTLLVVMAVVTTVATEPLLRLAYPDRLLKRDIADAERAALGAEDAYRVLVYVDDAAEDLPAVDAGIDLAASEPRAEVVLSQFLQLGTKLEIGSGLGGELDRMAETMDSLHTLAARATERQVHPVVRSQFSTDISEDLVSQARSIEADVVVARLSDGGAAPEEHRQLVNALLRDHDRDLGLVVTGTNRRDRPPTGSVVVVVADRPNDAAAVDLAVRIARVRGVPVRVLDTAAGRRAGRDLEALVRDITSLGIAAEARRAQDGLATQTDDAMLVAIGLPEASDAQAALGNGTGGLADPGHPVLMVQGRETLDVDTPRARVARLAAEWSKPPPGSVT